MAAMYYGGIQAVKNSSPYKEAVEMALKKPEVIEALGQPIQTGMLDDTGKFKDNDDGSRNVQFNIPVTGPKATGTIYVDALVSKEKVWTFNEVTFRLANSPTVTNLMMEEQLEVEQ